jgi:NADH-quinone oxidoreductase subunit F
MIPRTDLEAASKMTDLRKILLQDEEPVHTLEHYRSKGGFQALKKALEMSPGEIIDLVKRSGLRGRGGAGFPAGIKWDGVSKKEIDILGRPATRYLVCNFAEGEPGTYKDRYLMSRNPYYLIEGMAIASHAIGAPTAVICIKEIFHKEIDILTRVLEECYGASYLGENILGSGKNIVIELATGPDSYLLGEDRALLEVIEGKPAWPRWKGIIPVEYGLHGQPTCVNNVETLSHVPHIIQNGPDWFRSIGTPDTPGTTIITLTGDVEQPGMYEVPMGTSLKSVIYDMGGGPKLGRRIQAVFSGPTNAVIPASKIDTPLDFGSMRKIPSGLGSGGFIVYDDTACMVEVAEVFARFLWVESCGQCPACKLGTGRITEALEELGAGTGSSATLATLHRQLLTVGSGNRCFLPVEAQQVVGSILRAFPEDVVAHLEGRCPSPREIPLPKIVDLHDGIVVYDEHQAFKRPDWTYAA